MRASSVGWEIEINLTDLEIKLLGSASLIGLMNVHDVGGENYGKKFVTVSVGEINNMQISAELRTEPRAYIDKVERYFVTLSHDAYLDLLKNGATGDRMAWNSACKVLLKKEGHYS